MAWEGRVVGFYREKRSRGRREWTNDQTGQGMPREGWEGVGDPLPPP